MILIKNGRVVDAKSNTDGILDVVIDGGKIKTIGKVEDDGSYEQVIDADGCVVAPGLIDVHVHFRDPGQTQKEDVLTGAAAAAAGGYATVICMANTVPTCDTPEIIRYVTDKAKDCPVQVLQAGSVTKGLKGQELTDFDALLKAGAPCLTDDGINLTSAALCRTAMAEAAKRGTLLSFHEEEPSLVPSPGVNYGSAAAKHFGVPGAMASAESAMIGRDIALALDTGARVLFQHVSSAQSVALIRAGKAMGAKIYAEVTPHHLSLTEDDVPAHGTYARMNPPLRKEADRQALIAALADGTLDMVATDHAPHTAEEKAREFAKAPSGITGLETSLALGITSLVRPGHLSLIQLLEKMTINPAKLYHLPYGQLAEGKAADLVIFDENECWTPTEYASLSSNSPFTGTPMYGKVKYTICSGKIVYHD